MKYLLIACILIISFSAGSYIIGENNYITSTYDLKDSERQKKDLSRLSEKNLFAFLHKKTTVKLVKKHKEYFKSKPGFELIYSAKGDLFLNGKEDYAFIFYDKKKSQITILLYNESENKYFELYRDIKVERELTDCHYSYFGTLDYILGNEIIDSETLLTKNPEIFMNDYPLCKITDILNDETFILNSGCFAKGVSKNQPLNSLCIAASFVYNNWECLLYDKSKNRFKTIFGQAFSD